MMPDDIEQIVPRRRESIDEKDAGVMRDDDERELLGMDHYKILISIVNIVRSKGMRRDKAWLFAGAILQYTANGKIDNAIVIRTRIKGVYKGAVGSINGSLRTGKRDPGMQELIELMAEGLSMLPDYVPKKGEIPTRMMNAYPGIDNHYKVGNVLKMAEVGSVGKKKPPSATELYKRRYRLEFYGGLKDISNLNAAQDEVLYAPGSHYRVVSVTDGKSKDKKGQPGSPQSHRHIALQFIAADEQELRTMQQDKLIDLQGSVGVE